MKREEFEEAVCDLARQYRGQRTKPFDYLVADGLVRASSLFTEKASGMRPTLSDDAANAITNAVVYASDEWDPPVPAMRSSREMIERAWHQVSEAKHG